MDKMPRVRMFSRSVINVRPANMTLNLECSEEPLNEAQQKLRTKLKDDSNRVAVMLQEMLKDDGKLVCQVGSVSGYQFNTLPATPTPAPAVVQNNPQILNVAQQNKNSAPIKLNIGNTSGPQGNIQLVVDHRMGVILGPVTQTQGTATTTTSAASTVAQPQENYKYTRSGRRTKVLQVQQPDIIEEPAPALAPTPTVTRVKQKPTATQVTSSKATTTSQGVTSVRIKTVAKQANQSSAKPTEHTSIGGISIGKNTANEQIDESKKNQPDSREFTFNKTTGGRTFPSLVVVARPNLRNKDIPSPVVQKERQALDAKVKNVLMFSATKFAEWLIQQGLVKSEQYCLQHSSNFQKPKLKLGMYSDQGTFPYSGGYVWISSCCPDRFVSVFSGSIFQGAHYTPTVLLKLIYHWACQTNVQNVITWVKVSNIYLKNFYTNLRSICTAAVWDKSRKMGGKNSVIQVGVISLGTTSQDGHLRQVKVEVLGVLDPSTLDIRLRACEPMQDEDRSFKRRFNNILHPLKEWVHTDSKIMTDFTVDKSTLQDMGYNHVVQSAFSEQNPKNFMSNYHIMEYLRKIVPRMFQNTLSLLSRQMIQQFLDELIWREMYGATAERAFDNIIRHIAEQTKLDSNDSLLDRLSKVAANPFQKWSYSNPTNTPVTSKDSTPVTDVASSQKTFEAATTRQGVRRGRKSRIHTMTTPEHEVKRVAVDSKLNKEKEDKSEKDSKEQIQLQELYYATMEGDKNLISKETRASLYFKCFLCATVMRSNTEVMEHMVSHVPPQLPGQSELSVCRYCCTPLSSQHQMLTHVSETHSNFGHCDNVMVVCAICEEKFGKSKSLIDHLSLMHYPSEMPYKCESCGYRTSSHKDVIDHYYKIHEKGEGLQCPYCLKVIQFVNEGTPNASNVYAYLSHMQRHIVRRDQGKGNKCSRCCLWFNKKSSLTIHQRELHDCVSNPKNKYIEAVPYSAGNSGIMVSKNIPEIIRFSVDSPRPELPPDEKIQKWSTGPVMVNTSARYLSCQECEEDIDEDEHYPGEQRCQQCRYVTCCWRAFQEHQQQIHNERPKTSLIVPSPLVNIPLDKKLQCPCGYTSNDGNRLAKHLIKCKRLSAHPVEESAPSGMLDSLGLVPRTASEESDAHEKSNSRN
ncbi:relative of woc isoform X1 [Temnothorax americanus]|uniref:relative of woc isoform X1 n=1 Tax=Temnothorax americanus TaxID=1964332 RepID=UPI004068C6F7